MEETFHRFLDPSKASGQNKYAKNVKKPGYKFNNVRNGLSCSQPSKAQVVLLEKNAISE